MRAVEHYRMAEEVTAVVQQQTQAGVLTDSDTAQIRALLAHAQVHATLALAGATALQSYARVKESDGELEDWEAAAGGEPT